MRLLVVGMLVQEAMTKKVIAIDREKTILDACNLYRDHNVGCLLVTDQYGDCIGIITERDIIERTICAHKDPNQTKVGDIMSPNIRTIHALAKLEKAVEIMNENNIKKLPVLLKGDIVGIVTVTDISKALPHLTERSAESWAKPIWKD